MNDLRINNPDSNSAPYYIQFSLPEGIKQYIQKVQKAVAYCLSIRDTYSSSSYKQPLIAQPIYQPQKGPSDGPFYMTDLEIYPDDYSGSLPINGISKREYQQIKDYYENVIAGKSKIILDPLLSPELHRLVEMDLILLLTRPTSRKLLLAFSEHENATTLKDLEVYFEGLSEEEKRRPRESGEHYDSSKKMVGLQAKAAVIGSFICREINDQKNQFLCPSPHFIVLAHELIHALHYNRFGETFEKQLHLEKPTLSEDFDDLGEQFAVTGDAGDKAKYMEMNEQQICREFGIPYREDHRGAGGFSPDSPAHKILQDKELPIQKAARGGATLNIMHFLKAGGDVNLRFQKGFTLLHEASRIGFIKIATSLIDSGAEIDPIADDGTSPLHLCAISKKTNQGFWLGALLMDRGAEINRKLLNITPNCPVLTSTLLASRTNNLKLTSLLLDRGADLSDTTAGILDVMIRRGNVENIEIVDKLMSKHGITLTSENMALYFKISIQNVKLEMALFLINQGADINKINYDGTLLVSSILRDRTLSEQGSKEFEEIAKSRFEKVNFLLKHGAIPSLICEYTYEHDGYKRRTETAFHAGYRHRDIPLLSLLLKADTQGYLAKDEHGKSIYDWAKEENQVEVLDLIKPYIQASEIYLPSLSNSPAPIEAMITVKCQDLPCSKNLFIRGDAAGLNWDKGIQLTRVDWDTFQVKLCNPFSDKLQYKLLIDDILWEEGADKEILPGEKVERVHSFHANILPKATKTVMKLEFYVPEGKMLSVSGTGPLGNWDRKMPMVPFGDKNSWFIAFEGNFADFNYKLRLDDSWEQGDNRTARCGQLAAMKTPKF